MDAMMVKMSSLFGSNVHKFSFSKYTSTPLSLSFLTNEIVSCVLREKREMDFVMMRSILPSKASVIIRLNSVRLFELIPKTCTLIQYKCMQEKPTILAYNIVTEF